MPLAVRVLLCGLFTGLLLLASPAYAWELKTTSAGQPIRWADGEIAIDVSMAAESHGISRASGEAEVRAALQSWQEASRDTLRFAYAPQVGAGAVPLVACSSGGDGPS